MTPELEPVWKQFTETYAALRDILAEIPDDRLEWRPSPAATTPQWIVSHVIRANRVYATLAASGERVRPPLELIAGRAEIVRRLDESEADVKRVFEQLSENDLRRICAPDWAPLGSEVAGPLDALWFCQQIVRHTAYHLGQLNYITLLLAPAEPQS